MKNLVALYTSPVRPVCGALENTKRKVYGTFWHRQEFGQSKGDRKVMIEWKKDAEKSMHDTAMSVIRKIG